MKSFSIRTKLLGLILVILIPAFGVVGWLEVERSKDLIIGESIQKAKSDMGLGLALLDSTVPGEWSVQGDKLYKGSTLINDNYAVVDLIGKVTEGDTATIFLGDTRVTTNVMKDGERAVGTKASEEVVEAVLKKGGVFNGEANVVGHVYQSAYMPIKDASGTIIGMWYVGAPSADERIQGVIADVTQGVVLMAVIVVAVMFGLCFLFISPMTKQIGIVSGVMERVADGDLCMEAIPVRSGDEVGKMTRSLNRMVADLRGTISQVRETSVQVAAAAEQLTASAEMTGRASEQIASTMQEIAGGSDEQVRTIEQGQTVLADINRTVEKITRNAEAAAGKAALASERAETGNGAVRTAMDQMTAIDEKIMDLAEVIEELGQRSQHIHGIVETITGLAGQTGLLALNAAIESARAGEHGRGFAVVADEVRKLADLSSGSAQEIARTIGQIQEDILRATRSMKAGTEEVAVGIKVVHQAGEAFAMIQGDVRDVTQQVHVVAAATHEIAESTALTDSIGRIARLAESNASGTEQVSAGTQEQLATMEEVHMSSTELAKMAEELQERVSRFRV